MGHVYLQSSTAGRVADDGRRAGMPSGILPARSDPRLAFRPYDSLG